MKDKNTSSQTSVLSGCLLLLAIVFLVLAFTISRWFYIASMFFVLLFVENGRNDKPADTGKRRTDKKRSHWIDDLEELDAILDDDDSL